MFIDETHIEIVAGRGGDGCMAFHREKFVPKGGPSGGNGGRGGHVTLRAWSNLHTFFDMGHRRMFKAGNGDPGGAENCSGKVGEDVVLHVPVGTLVKDYESGILLADLDHEGAEFQAATGGKGGIGNHAFRSSTRQTPRKTTPGGPGERKKLGLELKLLADCGLVGFPNAGKSSLIRKMTSATPKIGDYPFTTIKPALGTVAVGTQGSFLMVDIPGLIEGAAEGKGLGHQFLRHIERTRCLAVVLDSSDPDPGDQYRILLDELGSFHPALLEKPRLILLNKSDLQAEAPAPFTENKGIKIISVSAVSGEGLEDFKKEVATLLKLGENRGWEE
jgi:GTP-binding protein